MKPPKFGEVVGATLAIGSLGLVGYAVVGLGDHDALIAVTTLLGIAAGYYLRGRVEGQSGS